MEFKSENSSPGPETGERRVLAEQCLEFAESVMQQWHTPWAHGCARVLREAAAILQLLHADAARPRSAPVEPRYLLQVPSWKREGREPVAAHKRCLYTLIETCKEQNPNDPDRWCGFCSETNVIPVQDAARPRSAPREDLRALTGPSVEAWDSLFPLTQTQRYEMASMLASFGEMVLERALSPTGAALDQQE